VATHGFRFVIASPFASIGLRDYHRDQTKRKTDAEICNDLESRGGRKSEAIFGEISPWFLAH
jgi:hypothetical protein